MQPGTKGDTGERPAVILREQFPTHRARVLYSSREIIFSSGTDSGNVVRSPNSYHVDVDDEGDVVRRYTCHRATRSTRSNLVVMCSTFHVFRPIMPVSPRGLRESWSNSVLNILPSFLSFFPRRLVFCLFLSARRTHLVLPLRPQGLFHTERRRVLFHRERREFLFRTKRIKLYVPLDENQSRN